MNQQAHGMFIRTKRAHYAPAQAGVARPKLLSLAVDAICHQWNHYASMTPAKSAPPKAIEKKAA
jgi:hypothetical protein